MATMKKSRGFSALEFILGAAVVSVSTVAVYDLSRVYQAKTALKAGVEAANRCVYPTDPECVSTTNLASAIPFFRYFKIDSPVQYEVPSYDYSGLASWLTGPIQNWQPNVTILDSVRYSLERKNYRAERVAYPVSRSSGIAVRLQSLPYIRPFASQLDVNGNAVPGAALAPQFVYENQRSTVRAPDFEIDLSGITLTASPGNPVTRTIDLVVTNAAGASQPFVVPDPFTMTPLEFKDQNWEVYDAARIDTPGATTALGAARRRPAGGCPGIGATLTEEKYDAAYSAYCEASTRQAQIGTHLTGVSAGGTGSISINLIEVGSGDITKLGGRSFTSSLWGNFAPRGWHKDSISPKIAGQYSELRTYPTRISFGRRYRLQLTLEVAAGNQNVRWTGNSWRAWWSHWAEAPRLSDCSPVSRSDFEAAKGKVSCVKSGKVEPKAIDVKVDTGTDVDNSFVALGCALSPSDANSAFVSGVPSGKTRDYDLIAGAVGSCSASGPLTKACPGFGESNGGKANYGVKDIKNAVEASAICPPKVGVGESTTGVSWTEKTVAVTEKAADGSIVPALISKTKVSCADNAGPVGGAGAWASAPKVTYTLSGVKGSTPLGVVGNPAELKKQPQYSCSDIGVEKIVYDDSNPATDKSSLFVGDQIDLGEGCWKDVLATEAKKIGVPSYAFFAGDRARKGVILFGSLPTLSCGVGAKLRYGGTGNETLVSPLGGLPEGTKPEACKSAVCRTELVTVSGSVAGDVSVNVSKAADVGFALMHNAMANLTRCEDSKPYCTRVSVEERNTPAGAVFRSTAKAQIPLLTFGGESVEIEVVSERGAERDFAS